MRLSQKTLLQRNLGTGTRIPTVFDGGTFEGSINEKGYRVVYEKAYMCPCKGQDTASHLNVCKNCGGVGWIFANPTEMKMIITSIKLEDKLKDGSLTQWGSLDQGFCMVTSYPDIKISYMDRITNIDGTAEHNEIIYPKLNDDEDKVFVYTRYKIESIDYLARFVDQDNPLARITSGYVIRDNVIEFDDLSLHDSQFTIRYVHNPTYHIIDLMRESITSYNDKTKIVLPNHGLARRAHLIQDIENYDGNRLLDNSWKTQCDL